MKHNARTIRYHGATYRPAFLYHVSAFAELAMASVGDTFTLRPGPQGAEGPGVYFSEGEPRFTAAEGAQRTSASAVVAIPLPANPKEWYRTKGSVMRKHGRPRTWHSKGRSVRCTVDAVQVKNGLPLLVCTAELV